MTRILTSMIIIIACAQFSSAKTVAPVEDSTEYNDVILLKNGGTVEGKILEIIPGDKVTIERRDGKELTIPVKKIFALTDTAGIDQRKHELELLAPEKTTMTWQNVTMIGLLQGEDNTIFQVSVTNGVLFGERTFLGLGIGYDNYPSGTVVPIVVSGKYALDWGSVYPFAFLDAGYGIGWLKGILGADYGGLTFSAGIGVRLAVGPGAMPLMQLGYRRQELKSAGFETRSYDFMTAKIGVVF